MRKFSLLLMTALAVLLSGSAQAQRKPMKPTMAHKPPMAATTTVTGMVKGKPAGKSFTLATSSKTYNVTMAKGGVVKNKATGKFMSLMALTGGSSVTVSGTASGTTLTAKNVTVNRLNGGKRLMKPAKMAPMKHGKM